MPDRIGIVFWDCPAAVVSGTGPQMSRLDAGQIRWLVLGSCDPAPGSDPYRLGRGYLNIPRLMAGLRQALAAPAGTRGAKEPTMHTDDIIAVLAAAPATAYREYLYRPHGQFGRWIGDRFEVVARPGRRIGRAPQTGDVLLQVRLGRIHLGRCVVLGDRDHHLAAPPPRLAPGQLLLRPRRRAALTGPLPMEPAAQIRYLAPGLAAEPWAAGPADDPTEAITPVTTLTSPRFAGDTDLDAVANGTLRLAAPGTSPYPAPVLSSGTAVAKIQQALIDLGYPLPQHGADGRFGAETGAAVTRYKTERGISPSDPVVGPMTMARLDQDITRHDPPGPFPPIPTIDVDQAVKANRRYGVELGWATRYDIEPLLGLNTPPSEQDFARAVANWQGQHGLGVDGIIGPGTWAAMDLILSAPPTATRSLQPTLFLPNTSISLSSASAQTHSSTSGSLAEAIPCSVTVSPNSLTLTQASQTLAAIGSPSSGIFSWTSSNPDIVSIDATSSYQATIRPVAPGTASITVTYSAEGTQCSDTASITVLRRNFIIVYGDRGKGVHNLGALPRLAAETHEREIRANQAPGVPTFLPSDTVITSHISTVSGLVGQIGINNVLYLAYFGHSWADATTGFLLIGQDKVPDSNLCDIADPTCTSAAALPKSAFLPDASVRLFGCRGGFGNDPAARQIAATLGIPVFGFDNSDGSIFTNDPVLGHGKRAATRADLHAPVVAGKPVWMVPENGVPHFKQF